MRRIRIIPVLLLRKNGLVKSVKFKDFRYVGDPINAVKIFNEKEVDEIAVIDIDASNENRGPDVKRITEIASEAFMPMSYGGGISSIDQVKALFYNGIEKVILNRSAIQNPQLITKIASLFGSQSVTISVDVKGHLLTGKRVYTENGRRKTEFTPVAFAKTMEAAGAGEILLNSIEKDGTYRGYDYTLIKEVAESVRIPVVAMGGAATLNDFSEAVAYGASAVAAGSMFVFQQPHNAVLISYPSQKDLIAKIYNNIV